MHTDHAEDQRKLKKLYKALKKEVTLEELGSVQLKNPTPEVQALLDRAVASTIERVGGLAAWSALSTEERKAHDVDMIRGLTMTLGAEAYEKLSDESKRQLDLFFRAGCCMHKELNSVKGGVAAMSERWKELEGPGPILLPNRDNRAVVELADSSRKEASAAERRAANVSTGGAVRGASLAGAIFNHKDGKKGQHDAYLYHFLHLTGRSITFPDTSNTRYQTYCLASAELLTHLATYRQYLEFIRDKKESRDFNNLEGNVYRGLHDPATLSEMAVLAFYGEAVSYPYASKVRGPGSEDLNVLKLGELHKEVQQHIQRLIDDPSLVLSPQSDPSLVTFDGKPWRHPNAITAIYTLSPNLPHLEALLVAFLNGALAVWIRFSGEFAPGGTIDTSTAQERYRAWMQPCNDAFEGILGTFRRVMHARPSLSEQHFNAQLTYERNNTQDFIDAKLSDEANQKFLRAEARVRDSSKPEQARKLDLAQAEIAAVEQKRAKERAKAEKAAQRAQKLAGVVLILDNAHILQLKVSLLDEQLDAHRALREDSSIPKKSHLKNKRAKQEALLSLVEAYLARHPADSNAPDTADGQVQ
ncbi:hypothetical protein PsYK624_167530 [Phanerochaete sordida]|uniref:Uncharacterized protein n=1 Tax=Phanerochaete sordida TaxID=48140 RepID=A0A9P3LNH4_9APHY|nr:hypothetical protein PsYK624_167530 [Phanerochaete sordida]